MAYTFILTKNLIKLIKLLQQWIINNMSSDSLEKTSSGIDGIIKIGNYVKYGRYVQDSSVVKEPIEWLVLDVNDDSALLITRYAIECLPFNDFDCNKECKDMDWNRCTIRTWLNNDFIATAFSGDEAAKLIVSELENTGVTHKDPGTTTSDKVFFLSIDEANKYFNSSDERMCKPTPYVKGKGAFIAVNDNCFWWLRSSGVYEPFTACVNYVGDVNSYGYNIASHLNGLRIALRIKL
jgi:hypothetical protein